MNKADVHMCIYKDTIVVRINGYLFSDMTKYDDFEITYDRIVDEFMIRNNGIYFWIKTYNIDF